jgi:surface antigen
MLVIQHQHLGAVPTVNASVQQAKNTARGAHDDSSAQEDSNSNALCSNKHVARRCTYMAAVKCGSPAEEDASSPSSAGGGQS